MNFFTGIFQEFDLYFKNTFFQNSSEWLLPFLAEHLLKSNFELLVEKKIKTYLGEEIYESPKLKITVISLSFMFQSFAFLAKYAQLHLFCHNLFTLSKFSLS